MIETLEYYKPGTIFYVIGINEVIEKSITNLTIKIDDNNLPSVSYNAGKNGEFNWFTANKMFINREDAEKELHNIRVKNLNNKLIIAKAEKEKSECYFNLLSKGLEELNGSH